jgi:RNA polymerase primary sigma factor
MKDKKGSHNIIFNQEEIYPYLRDIRKIKVLTPEREKELSKIMTSEGITQEEKQKIEKELVEGNLRFVITIAKQYQNQGMELPDLIAEGNFGLIKAIKNFDWTKENRFISYAVWWIRQTILQSLNENARTIRLPVNIVQEIQKEKKKNDDGNSDVSEKLSSLPSIVYLDNTINEDGDCLIDVVMDENTISPDYIFNTKEELNKRMLSILTILDDREKIIVEDYFGLNGNSKTLEEIGEDLDLTKERVRQIKERALRKLRNESDMLFDYI